MQASNQTPSSMTSAVRRGGVQRILAQCIAFLLVAASAGAQTGTVMPSPKFTIFDNSGNPVSGGKLCSYVAGTTTPANTYTDSTLTSANTNPVVADSAGRATVFLSSGSSYKFVARLAGSDSTCATGTVLWTVDNVLATPATTSNLDVLGTAGEAVSAGQVLYLSDGSGSKTPGLAMRLASLALSVNASTAPCAIPTIGDTRAVDALIGGLLGPNWMVRRHAAEALGKIGDPRSAEALIQSLQDEDWLVRRNAAESLARLGAKQAIEPLLPLLEDENTMVQETVEGVLASLGWKQATSS